VPTPNGRLHLGHIGGPYLTVDVLARFLRLNGHKAVILSGTDSFDSYVTGQAAKEGLTPAEVCNKYHEMITADLKSMNIDVAQFVNPISDKASQTYKKWHNQILAQLQANGATTAVKESVTWDFDLNRYMTGCWLTGKCPHCKQGVAGYFCEDCGAHFRPEEVLEANAGAKSDRRIQKQVTNLFMKLPAFADLTAKGVNQKIQNIYKQFLERQGGLIRLTASTEWGMPVVGQDADSRMFNYSVVFAYFLMLGEIAGQLLGSSKNVFEQANHTKDTQITTIASFGIDNAVPFLGSFSGVTAGCPEYKQFDYYLVNYFYDLDGSKFSTSRRHAIWVDEIINRDGASSDIVRLYLSTIDVRNQGGNFVADEFLAYYNKTVNWVANSVVKALANLPATVKTTFNATLAEKLEKLTSKQANYLDPANFQPHQATVLIDEWLAVGSALDQTTAEYFWWLKGLVLLVAPFMPQLAQTIWTALGYVGEPTILNFQELPSQPIQRNVLINTRQIKPLGLGQNLHVVNTQTFAGVAS
jgi:methionyl-tRNA synthetase